jgi:hypothetical protein
MVSGRVNFLFGFVRIFVLVRIGGDECFDDNVVSEFVVGVVEGGVL